MRIVDLTTDVQETLEIVQAKYVRCYRLELTFSDGTVRSVDFEPFLRSSAHMEIAKYLDMKNFMAFGIVNGNLDWNDYDLCFPISDLYEGKNLVY